MHAQLCISTLTVVFLSAEHPSAAEKAEPTQNNVREWLVQCAAASDSGFPWVGNEVSFHVETSRAVSQNRIDELRREIGENFNDPRKGELESLLKYQAGSKIEHRRVWWSTKDNWRLNCDFTDEPGLTWSDSVHTDGQAWSSADRELAIMNPKALPADRDISQLRDLFTSPLEYFTIGPLGSVGRWGTEISRITTDEGISSADIRSASGDLQATLRFRWSNEAARRQIVSITVARRANGSKSETSFSFSGHTFNPMIRHDVATIVKRTTEGGERTTIFTLEQVVPLDPDRFTRLVRVPLDGFDEERGQVNWPQIRDLRYEAERPNIANIPGVPLANNRRSSAFSLPIVLSAAGTACFAAAALWWILKRKY